MIITVTLNAAIDKSLAVPNFRLGRRPVSGYTNAQVIARRRSASARAAFAGSSPVSR